MDLLIRSFHYTGNCWGILPSPWVNNHISHSCFLLWTLSPQDPLGLNLSMSQKKTVAVSHYPMKACVNPRCIPQTPFKKGRVVCRPSLISSHFLACLTSCELSCLSSCTLLGGLHQQQNKVQPFQPTQETLVILVPKFPLRLAKAVSETSVLSCFFPPSFQRC